MPSKNSLSALKADQPAILPKQAADGQLVEPNRGGRPRRPPSEKRSHKIQLSLTPSEAARLKEKAGLAGEATFIYAKLREIGFFD